MRVFKYELRFSDNPQAITLPLGSSPRFFGMQNNKLHVWIEVADAQTEIEYQFHVFGTGHEIPNPYIYVGSLQDAPFVWHLYCKF